jgi:hypothetical protein
MATLDLDGLASEPLVVTIGGAEYTVKVTVGTMVAASKADQSDPMELTRIVMEASGMPSEVFMAMNPAQAGKLNEIIVATFFPKAEVEEKAEPVAA